LDFQTSSSSSSSSSSNNNNIHNNNNNNNNTMTRTTNQDSDDSIAHNNVRNTCIIKELHKSLPELNIFCLCVILLSLCVILVLNTKYSDAMHMTLPSVRLNTHKTYSSQVHKKEHAFMNEHQHQQQQQQQQQQPLLLLFSSSSSSSSSEQYKQEQEQEQLYTSILKKKKKKEDSTTTHNNNNNNNNYEQTIDCSTYDGIISTMVSLLLITLFVSGASYIAIGVIGANTSTIDTNNVKIFYYVTLASSGTAFLDIVSISLYQFIMIFSCHCKHDSADHVTIFLIYGLGLLFASLVQLTTSIIALS